MYIGLSVNGMWDVMWRGQLISLSISYSSGFAGVITDITIKLVWCVVDQIILNKKIKEVEYCF